MRNTIINLSLVAGAIAGLCVGEIQPASSKTWRQQLAAVGVQSIQRQDCYPGLLAYYNYAKNTLTFCENNITSDLHYERVFNHELVHVVQDCAHGGIASPRTGTLADVVGGSEGDKFAQTMMQATPDAKLEAIHNSYKPGQFGIEVEANALMNHPDLVSHLFHKLCL